MNLKWTARETEIEKKNLKSVGITLKLRNILKQFLDYTTKRGNSQRGTDEIWRNEETKFRVCSNPFNKTKEMTQTLGEC